MQPGQIYTLALGQVQSEAVMNVLSEKIGRAKAYGAVKDAIADAPEDKSFTDAVKNTPTITKHLSNKEIEAALDPSHYLGVSEETVEQAIKQVRAEQKQP